MCHGRGQEEGSSLGGPSGSYPRGSRTFHELSPKYLHLQIRVHVCSEHVSLPLHATTCLFLTFPLVQLTFADAPFHHPRTSATSPLLGIIGTPHINLNHGGQRHRHRVPGHARSGPGLRLQFSARQKVNIQSGDEVVGVLCLAGTLRTAFSRLNTGNIITALIQGDEAGAAQFKPALSLSPLP